MFPYSHLIFWEEEVEDIFLMFEDPPPIEEDRLQIFLDCLRDYLKNIDRSVISEPDITQILKPSKTYDSVYDGKSVNMFETNEFGIADELVGKRAIVPVYPCGFRDTCVLEKRSLNAVWKSE